MIDGVIGICDRCGGEVTLSEHLVDGHKGDDGQPHLVWQHFTCGMTSEFVVSRQTLRACTDYNRAEVGKIDDDERQLSEDEQLLIEFGVQIHVAQTPEDFGWEDYVTLAENAVEDVARHHQHE